jgi:predicted 3-demethylubiquinone-9 3-methyltransferase (glyoxalase superfamily)
MTTKPKQIDIATCLWFNKNAEEAATFYAKTFPNSRVMAVLGQPFVGLNGGPGFPFNQAVSFQVFTDTQEETDGYWNAIVKDGGQEIACGWCKDKFGLSWQIVPRVLMEAINDSDTASAKRAMEAMMQMIKIDIAKIKASRLGKKK